MATPIVSTGNFPELLWPGLFEIWGDSYKDDALVFPKIFQQEKSKQRFDTFWDAYRRALPNRCDL